MRILFDQGTPLPLKDHLKNHRVATVFELGWSTVENGKLLAAAETSFDLLITTDQQICHQQRLTGRELAILVLLTTNWPLIRKNIPQIQAAIEKIKPGDYREVLMR